MIDSSIPSSWFTLPPEIRSQIKVQLFNFSNNPTNFHPKISKLSSRILAKLGMHEWPEQWPSFFEDCISAPTFHIFSLFAEDLLTDRQLPVTQKLIMRNFIITILPNLVQNIFQRAHESPYSLILLLHLVKWVPLERVIDPLKVSALTHSFLQDRKLAKQSLQIIRKIFVERYDIEQLIPPIGYTLISNLYRFISVNNEIPILISQILATHITQFHNIQCSSPNAQKLLLDILKILTNPQWSKLDVTLYWTFWSTFFRFYFVAQQINENNIVKPFLTILFQNMYEILHLSVDNSLIIDENARICIVIITNLKPDFVMKFLDSQNISKQLCYASACTVGCFSSPDFSIQLMNKLIRSVTDKTDEEVICAFILTLAKNLKVLYPKQQILFKYFVKMTVNVFNSNNQNYLNAFVIAVKYLLQKFIQVFTLLDYTLTKLITKFLSNLSPVMFMQPAVSGLFNAVASISSLCCDENSMVYIIQESLKSCVQFITANADNVLQMDDENLALYVKVLKIVDEFNTRCPSFSSLAGGDILNVVVKIISCYNLPEDTHNLMEICYSLAGSLICLAENWDEIAQQFQAILQSSIENLNFGSFSLSFFTIIRKIHNEEELFFPIIFEKIALPLLNDSGEETEFVFEFLEVFQYWNKTDQFPIQIIQRALKNMPIHSVKTVLEFIDGFLSSCDLVPLSKHLENSGKDILDVIITVLLDSSFDRYYSKEIKLFQNFIDVCMKCYVDENKLTEVLHQILTAKLPQTDDGFIMDFINYLKQNIEDINLVDCAFSNFLYTVHCSIPFKDGMFAKLDSLDSNGTESDEGIEFPDLSQLSLEVCY
ncbi:hypothetical protein GPJ56_010991 [Histomonas meleagridis]|uniref:uncharacterized protein n=1 Tax=Histomonas meleagridis TaxID=135588 RepID=UPI0035596598|nr:hypothetical protein GPJ56_010991 [Histomonas meleagridis]KAH0800768.1 hypothetical protein GO595_006521 [Histomonas meleagridis]